MCRVDSGLVKVAENSPVRVAKNQFRSCTCKVDVWENQKLLDPKFRENLFHRLKRRS